MGPDMATERLQDRVAMTRGVRVETAAQPWRAGATACRIQLDPEPLRWGTPGSQLGIEIQASSDGGATWGHWVSVGFASGAWSGKGAGEQWVSRELGRRAVGDELVVGVAPTHLRAVMECRADPGTPTTCGLTIEWIAGQVDPIPIHHSIALVQSTGKVTENGGDGVLAATFGSTPGAGNFIGVCSWAYSGTALPGYGAGSCTDNKGNSYSRSINQESQSGSDRFGAAIYAALNIASSATFTVTMDLTATSAHLHLVCLEFSGVETSAALDKTAVGTTTGGSPTSGNSGTLAQADELVLVVGCFATGDPTTAIAAEAGYTQVAEEPDDGASQAGEADYKIVAATTAEECTWTVANPSNVTNACLATFKQAAAGGATVRPRSLTMTGVGS
jgi:hypothetical protein